MTKNTIAFSFYGILLLCLVVCMLPACGSDQTVIVDAQRCYVVEIVNNIGEHILVPISEIETMEYLGPGWFIWKKDDTGWWNVEVVGYSKDPNCK